MLNVVPPVIAATPVVERDGLAPIIVAMGAAVLATLVEALPSAAMRSVVNGVIMLLSLVAALVLAGQRLTAVSGGVRRALTVGVLIEDRLSLGFQAVLSVIAILTALVVLGYAEPVDGSSAPQAADIPGSPQENYAMKTRYQRTGMYALLLFSTGGMMAFIAAGNLLMLFAALEIMSLSLYVLGVMGRRRRLLSQEAGFKYFLLGVYASAFFLMSIALIYGFTGTLNLAQITQLAAVAPGLDQTLLVGVAMLLVGLFFKVSAVPFHAWAPSVYQGAPAPISGFMASGVKVAVFAVLVCLSMMVAGLLSWDLSVFLQTVIIATMLVGTFLGVIQTDIKRMLAHSSVAHVGFILVALVGSAPATSVAVLFCVLVYGAATTGTFALISVVREESADATVLGGAAQLSAWDGPGWRYPVSGAVMAVFLISFAGIPFAGGFIGRSLVFREGSQLGAGELVLLGLLASVATAFSYFRVIMRMFMVEPDAETASVGSGDLLTKAVVVLCAVGTVAFGIFVQPVLTFFAQLWRFAARRFACAHTRDGEGVFQYFGDDGKPSPPLNRLRQLLRRYAVDTARRSPSGFCWCKNFHPPQSRVCVIHCCTIAAPPSLTRVVPSLRRRFPAAHFLSCDLCEWELRLERRGDWLSYPHPSM